MTPIQHYILTIEPPDSPRYQMCAQTFADAGLEPTFIQGINGLTPEAEALHSPLRARLFHKYPLTAGEVACTFGHWRMLRRFLDTDDAVCAIYEDDVVLPDPARLIDLHSKAWADPTPPWDILRLHDVYPSKVAGTEDWQGEVLTRYHVPPAGSAAYLVTRTGARRILSRKHIFRPYDTDISHCWELGLRVRCVVPNPVQTRPEDELASSLETARDRMRKQKSLLRSIKGELHGLYAKAAGRLLSR
ncbi:glycosyltransferase family 25 protein [uncultured Tateyamaria sp.]|uniref:glycosyltransferase family 25 protein n=1 Tax=Tateyamaria sp. 1078 TaxID=3417464 RepID=UPI0026326738|nr:glycosyltransferase family 25 protein [uncultured Tateyamaria sp.]